MNNLILELLRREVLPTMGCTEPGAVALAAAYAGQALAGEVTLTRLEVIVNGNVYKNGAAVGIPGTGETGLYIAAALGATKKNPEKQLAVLSDITSAELESARKMVKGGAVVVRVDEDKEGLYIKVRLEAGQDYAEALIADRHTNLVSLVRNGHCIFSGRQAAATLDVRDCRKMLRDKNITIEELITAVEAMEAEELEFMMQGAEMNFAAAQAGLEKRLGMGIGAMYSNMLNKGLMSDDLVNYAKTLTAAAADARMSGESVPVMSSAGSGNHGITVIMPVYAVAKRLDVSREKTVKAIAISHIVTIYIKMFTGNLSALCGCAVAAAAGASTAVTWLMGGSLAQAQYAIKNVIANLAGMICDGGKVGCALKLSTAAAAAVEGALLAVNDIVVPDTNGIVASTAEQTITNLGRVSNPGMLETDKIILNIMMAKSV